TLHCPACHHGHRSRLLYAAQHIADECNADDARSARHRSRDFFFRALSRANAGGRDQWCDFRPFHRRACIPDRSGRPACTRFVVRARAEATRQYGALEFFCKLQTFALRASADSNPPQLAKRVKVGSRGRTDLNIYRPRETRSISARTMRSTRPGRLSSSQDLSIGRSISLTRSSSVRAFCPMMVCASVLKARSTAAIVSLEINPRSSGGAGLLLNTTSDVPSIVRKVGAGAGAAIASVRSNTSAPGGFGAAFEPSSSARIASISS